MGGPVWEEGEMEASAPGGWWPWAGGTALVLWLLLGQGVRWWWTRKEGGRPPRLRGQLAVTSRCCAPTGRGGPFSTPPSGFPGPVEIWRRFGVSTQGVGDP